MVMALSAAALLQTTLPPSISPFSQNHIRISTSHVSLSGLSSPLILRASAESSSTETEQDPAVASTTANAPSKLPKKPVYSMKKGQIVRVEKDKYLNSINYLSVDHPPYYKGLDYIYEDRGEVLDLRIFETGEYALIAWVGVPTAPAWLPTDMLIKSDKLNYERI